MFHHWKQALVLAQSICALVVILAVVCATFARNLRIVASLNLSWVFRLCLLDDDDPLRVAALLLAFGGR